MMRRVIRRHLVTGIILIFIAWAMWTSDYWDRTPLCTPAQIGAGGRVVSRDVPFMQRDSRGNYNLVMPDGGICKIR